jgi:ATP-dependent Clp protease ATP-binding subunit ClpA
MGARPMARLIQDTIRRALADELLFGKLQHGGKVTIDLGEAEKIVLKFEEEPAAVA